VSAEVQQQVPWFTTSISPERRTGTNGFSFMETATLYRQFAEECRRFAQSAKEEHRKVLLEMEAVWMRLATEAEAGEADGRKNR
jgi:hypothetical protein